MKLMVLAAALACPVAAWAECPTRADLERGVTISYDDGATELYQRTGPNIVTAFYRAPDGVSTASLLAQGVYLVQTIDMIDGAPDAGSRATYTYPLSPGEMPMPEPGGFWQADVLYFDRSEALTVLHDMTFGAETTLTIGPCRYRMVPIEVRYEGDGEVLHYMPDLGIAPIGAWGVGENREMMVYSGLEARP
jgi:hypothetical protein